MGPIEFHWQRGPALQWRVDRETQITGVEFKGEVGGSVLSVRIDGREQLMFAPVPMAMVLRDAGRVNLPTLKAGAVLSIQTEGLSAMVRPTGYERE